MPHTPKHLLFLPFLPTSLIPKA
jgi:hypothetical protein